MSDSSSDETDECLKEVLGGVCFDGVDWQEENENNNMKKLTPGLVEAPKVKSSRIIAFYSFDNEEEEDPMIFSNAYRCTPDGRIERPPVRVVNMEGSSNNKNNNNTVSRGNGLVATQFIPRGTVVYTEEAATATQPLETNSISNNNENRIGKKVQACEFCFRSLEPISKLLSDNNSNGGGDGDGSRASSLLPHPEFWPILPLDFVDRMTDDLDEDGNKFFRDKVGRVKCTTCHSLFCSTFCHSHFHAAYGSCCAWTRIQKACIMASSSFPIDPPIVLGTRLFCHMLQYYRKHQNHRRRRHSCHNGEDGSKQDNGDGRSPLAGHFFSGFCGTHDNLNALELGEYKRRQQQDGNSYGHDYYTLQSLYERLQTILEISTKEERRIFDLSLLHTAVAKAARNGFGIRTQSPFKTYYAGLLRQSGGQRDSPKHRANMNRVVRAIFSSSSSSSSSSHDNIDDNNDCKLEQGMDRIIEQMVAPEVCAIFSLTARCNHACVPNAYVCSQEYIDAHIDVVAQRDIAVGEEILISYIGSGGAGGGMGKKSTAQRQRELRARYLFHCDCSECRLNAVV